MKISQHNFDSQVIAEIRMYDLYLDDGETIESIGAEINEVVDEVADTYLIQNKDKLREDVVKVVLDRQKRDKLEKESMEQ